MVGIQADPNDEPTFQSNLKRHRQSPDRKREAFRSASDDLGGIEYVYRHFHRFGPDINYTSSINGRSGSGGSYARIMSALDVMTGIERTYLANEANFAVVKTLQSKNLIVPIVGTSRDRRRCARWAPFSRREARP